MSMPAWMARYRAEADRALEPLFRDGVSAVFDEAQRYPVFGGGKRVRPVLALLAYEAVTATGPAGADGDLVDLSPAHPAAAAVELVHTYSLVHDDLPAMDDDDERRGRPTVHRAFDEATAILVGDSLLTEAFAVLVAAPWPDAVRVAAVRTLARAAGHLGMIGGQVLDVGLAGPVTTVEQVEHLHRLKTGALLECSAALGALVAGADTDRVAALGRYGSAVGLAFQLADDLLDADEDAGDDGPPSFVKLLGLDGTRARARALADEAVAAVADLPGPERLQELARYIVERDV